MRNTAFLISSVLFATACSMVPASLQPGAKQTTPSAAPAPQPAPRPQQDAVATAPSQRNERLEQRFAYNEAIRPHQPAIGTLALLAADKHSPATPERTLELFASFDKMDTLAQQCEMQFSKLTEVAATRKEDQPSVVCPLVARRKELGTKMLELAARSHIDRAVRQLKNTIDQMAKGELLNEGNFSAVFGVAADSTALATKLRAEVAPLYAKLGAEAPDELFVPLATIKTDLASAVDKSQQQVSIKKASKHPDAKAEKEVREIFKGARFGDKPTKVLAVQTISKNWNMYSHQDTGIPWFRLKKVLVLVQVQDESFCRMYEVDVRQEYSGGGTWQAGMSAARQFGVQVASCK